MLTYLTRSRLPSPTANSIQSAHMMHAFADQVPGFSCVYLSPKQDSSHSEHFAAYGLTPPASCTALTGPFLADWTSTDLLPLAKRLHIAPSDHVVYTRSLRQAAVATTLGRRTFLELHDPLSLRRLTVLHATLGTGRVLGLIATTPRLANDLASAFPRLPRTRILIAYNAASSRLPETNAAPILRSPYHTMEIAYAGSAFPGKGAGQVVAMANLRPSYRFHLIGPGDALPSDPPNLLRHGRVTSPQVFALLKSMDALLLPNQRSVIIRSGADIGAHTSPLKLFEYMASGRPIIASDLPIFHGILRVGENALLAPPESPEAFCTALDRIAANPDLSERLGAAAQADFLANHTWDIRARRILDFIASIVPSFHHR